jgi:hypothetical protein
VGGILTRGIDQGRIASRMALSILEGKSVSDIPIEHASTTVPMFDDVQLKRHKLQRRDLPEGSIVINRPSSWIEQHTRQVLILFCVLLGLSIGMGLRLLVVRRRAIRMAEAAKILEEKVADRTRLLETEKTKLQETLSQVRTLQGLLPICASCKKIRDDQGYWSRIESYISKHTDAKFSHGLCPDCASELYGDLYTKK